MDNTTSTNGMSLETMRANHDDFWTRTKDNAHSRLEKLFSDSGIDLVDVIGGDGVIRNYVDAKKALAFILKHANDCSEKACGILSTCEWLHACNELHESVSHALSHEI